MTIHPVRIFFLYCAWTVAGLTNCGDTVVKNVTVVQFAASTWLLRSVHNLHWACDWMQPLDNAARGRHNCSHTRRALFVPEMRYDAISRRYNADKKWWFSDLIDLFSVAVNEHHASYRGCRDRRRMGHSWGGVVEVGLCMWIEPKPNGRSKKHFT